MDIRRVRIKVSVPEWFQHALVLGGIAAAAAAVFLIR
jgi:hypothetical protein